MGVDLHGAPKQQRGIGVWAGSVLVWGKQHNSGQVPPASSALTLCGAQDVHQRNETRKAGILPYSSQSHLHLVEVFAF